MKKITLSVILVLCLAWPGTAFAQGSVPELIINGAVEIPDNVAAAVYIAVTTYPQAPQNVAAWAVTDAQAYGTTYYVSVAALAEASGGIDSAIWFGVVVASPTLDPDIYQATVQPPQAVGGGNSVIDPGEGGGSTGRIFPWKNGTGAWYGVLGVHESGWSSLSDWVAVDFVSDASTGMAPNMLYASTSGSVTWVCRDGVSLAVRIGDIIYAHLVDNGIQIGSYYAQGAPIGALMEGNFDAPESGAQCGYGSQSEGTFHVHFIIPTADPTYAIESCILDIPSGDFYCNGETISPGEILDATWQGGGITDPGGQPPPTDETTTKNLWGAMLDGITALLTLVVYGVAPTHTQLGISEVLVNSTGTAVGALFILFFNQFRPVFLINVVLIVMALETIKIFLSIMAWMKKIVPFMR